MNSRLDRKKRIERIKRKKRKMLLRRLRFYLLIGLIISLSVCGFKSRNKNENGNEAAAVENASKTQANDNPRVTVPRSQHKEAGEIESIIEYETNGLIGAHYPVFGKKNIDAINKELITEYIKEFKNELDRKSFNEEDYKYELSIDYETDSATDNIVSVSYDIIKDSSYLAHPDDNIVTKIYDLASDKELKLEDIMKDGYLEYIAQISEKYFKADETYKRNIDSELFQEGIYPSLENYSNFVLKDNKIVFIFKKYQLFSGNFGITSVEIAYSDLKDYIKPDLFEKFTKEEDPSKVAVNPEKPIVAISMPKRIIDPNKPMIALTFDDGPNKKTTIPILETLKKHQAVATFFILGNRVSSNVEILQDMLKEGNEIGNHSFNHKELTKLSYEGLIEQINKTQDAVMNATGIEPKLVRPTYGSYDDNLKSNIDLPLILWSIDTLDWKSRDSKKVTDHVLENVKDGDVILMHDIYDSTAEAVELLVPELINRGYQLVTVSELFEIREESLKGGQIYNQIHKK